MIIISLHDFYKVERIEEKDFLIAFGKNLRRLRKEKDFTQESLANEIEVDISQISRIERGIISTTLGMVHRLSKALKIEIIELFLFK